MPGLLRFSKVSEGHDPPLCCMATASFALMQLPQRLLGVEYQAH